MPNQQGNIPNMGAQNKGSSSGKKILKQVIFAFLIIVIAVILSFWIKDLIFKDSEKDPATLSYSAVFITNGQVYFGKIVSKNDSEFILSDVYYLQLSESSQTTAATQDQLSEPKFSLIKLGNEIHGPTDKLYINSSQVLFYEDLREDSRVVQSIKNYK